MQFPVQSLLMIQAFLTRYTELYPDNVDGKMGEEYLFNLWEDDVLAVRIADEGYEYSWQSLGSEWYTLQSVSQLKELLNYK
jgi:hypothetical protein